MINDNKSLFVTAVTGDKPSAIVTKATEEWECNNYLVMSWLWNNMKPSVSANFIFVDSAKDIWDEVHAIYTM